MSNWKEHATPAELAQVERMEKRIVAGESNISLLREKRDVIANRCRQRMWRARQMMKEE